MLAAILMGLALGLSACGGSDDTTSTGSASTLGAAADLGCNSRYPNRESTSPPGYVVACTANGGHSLELQNVSSTVLRVWANGPVQLTKIGLGSFSTPAPGVNAAYAVTSGGWDQNYSTFVLPLAGSLVATRRDAPVSVKFQADPQLTAEANTARYLAEWVASRLTTRGQALARRVQSCATSASGLADQSQYVEDVLRSALGTQACFTLVDDVLREERAPATTLQQVRKEVYGFARPALDDQLISRVATILAHR